MCSSERERAARARDSFHEPDFRTPIETRCSESAGLTVQTSIPCRAMGSVRTQFRTDSGHAGGGLGCRASQRQGPAARDGERLNLEHPCMDWRSYFPRHPIGSPIISDTADGWRAEERQAVAVAPDRYTPNRFQRASHFPDCSFGFAGTAPRQPEWERMCSLPRSYTVTGPGSGQSIAKLAPPYPCRCHWGRQKWH